MMSQTQITANGKLSRERNGHNVTTDPHVNPFDKPKVATPARMDDWKPFHYAVADLPRQKRWANSLAFKVERTNAMRNPATDSPTMYVPGPDCVAAGATDADMKALHKLTNNEIAALRMEAAVIRKDCQRQVDEMARGRAAADAASRIAIPERVNLEEFIPAPVQWVVNDLLAWNGVLGLFAERKAGKSHVARELIRTALDGGPFLGRFQVNLADEAEVALFDTEMPINMLHSQYHRSGVQNLGRLNLRALRGREAALDARVPDVRARWCNEIRPGSLIVVDCLYSLFGALGVSENSDEVVGVLAGLRALATESEAVGLVVVHHLGKDAERGARGHSSIEGFPDAIARIELDGPPGSETSRTFSAYGRDVSVDAGTLTLGADHRLTLGGNPKAERVNARLQRENNAVWTLVERHPGLSVRGLSTLPVEYRGKLSRDRIREAVDRLAAVNRVVNKGSDAAPEWHAVAGADPYCDAAEAESQP